MDSRRRMRRRFYYCDGDYVKASGDVEFAKANWDHLRRAYQFLNSTYADGSEEFWHWAWLGRRRTALAGEIGVLPERTGGGSAKRLAHLAKLLGKDDVAKTLSEQSEKERKALNTAFWSDEKKIFAFALDNENKRVDEASVLATVPMWFGMLDEEKASAMISKRRAMNIRTDWGIGLFPISRRNTEEAGITTFGVAFCLRLG